MKIELTPGTEYMLNGHILIAPEHHPVHASLIVGYESARARIETQRAYYDALATTDLRHPAPVYADTNSPRDVSTVARSPSAPDADEASGSETQTAVEVSTSPAASAAAAIEDVLAEIERAISGVKQAERINLRPVQQTGVAMSFLCRARSQVNGKQTKAARELLEAAQRIMRGEL